MTDFEREILQEQLQLNEADYKEGKINAEQYEANKKVFLDALGETAETAAPESPPASAPPAAAPPPMPEIPKIHLNVNGQNLGTFDRDAIIEKIRSGEINRDAMVWQKGMDNWIKAGEWPVLENYFPEQPPPMPLEVTPPPMSSTTAADAAPPPPASVINAGAGIKKTTTPPGNYVILKNVTKLYTGSVRAVDNISIGLGYKEFVVLLGPSGCGKSAVLRMIAGFDEITEGELIIDGELLNDVPAIRRNVAMVTMDYADEPGRGFKLPLGIGRSKSLQNQGAMSWQMTAYENMAFDLRNKKVSKDEIDSRINETAKSLDLDKLLDRKLTALSGGQRWRVSLGRALVRKPKVFLFDDPLSKIDNQKLRDQLTEELSGLHRSLNRTMIYATADQSEVMTGFADRVIVMKDGKIQSTTPP